MSNKIIEVIDLTKIYNLKGKNKSITALDNLNFKINENEKFALLGPNGAGKTTLISILTTLLHPTSGYAIIDGYNILKEPNRVKNKLGLMLGSDMVYHRLTGHANLRFFCKIYGISNYKEKIYNVAKELELDKWLKQYVSTYSTGMKIKLSLCRILLTNPKFFFLDEPALGLDIKTTNFIIEKLKKLDKTILLSSHRMDVVEKLCTRIAFLDKGKIKRIGTKDELRKMQQEGINIQIDITDKKNQLRDELGQQKFIDHLEVTSNGLIINIKERINYQSLFSVLIKYKVLKVKELDISIEDFFLKII